MWVRSDIPLNYYASRLIGIGYIVIVAMSNSTPTEDEAKEQIETTADAVDFLDQYEAEGMQKLQHEDDADRIQKRYLFHSDKDSEIYFVCLIVENNEVIDHAVAGVEWTIE